jgi:hypothetical protein
LNGNLGESVDSPGDEAAVGIGVVVGEDFPNFLRGREREERDAAVGFLAVELAVVAERLELGAGDLSSPTFDSWMQRTSGRFCSSQARTRSARAWMELTFQRRCAWERDGYQYQSLPYPRKCSDLQISRFGRANRS